MCINALGGAQDRRKDYLHQRGLRRELGREMNDTQKMIQGHGLDMSVCALFR